MYEWMEGKIGKWVNRYQNERKEGRKEGREEGREGREGKGGRKIESEIGVFVSAWLRF